MSEPIKDDDSSLKVFMLVLALMFAAALIYWSMQIRKARIEVMDEARLQFTKLGMTYE